MREILTKCWRFFQRNTINAKQTKILRVNLFSSPLHWTVFIAICGCIFTLNLYQEYQSYLRYLGDLNTKEIQGQVIAQYTKQDKNGKPYFVIKLRSQDGHILYTTSKEDIKDLSHSFVRIFGKPLQCDFLQYLRSCFFVNFSLSLESQKDSRNVLREAIDRQHAQESMASLYKTLYFADFLPKELRDTSNKLGIAHLVAISGFHLGVLSLSLGFVLSLVYRIFQSYFPYRNRFFDLSLLVLVFLFIYLCVLSFTPSFLRAWVMAAFSFVLLYSGVKVLDFTFLFLVGVVCVSLFPHLICSVGFFLSFMGVFYVYLFLRYFRFPHHWIEIFILPLLFNAVIFLNMLIVVHFFFPYFSAYSIASILLSIAFCVFFPLSIVGHVFGVGWIFDSLLLKLFGMPITAIEVFTPTWLFIVYLCLGLLSMRFVKAYILLLTSAVAFLGYLYYNLWVA
ncbi:MAG: ComEC/Rec2 family competence protein [Helicobacter sp.]|nr:ComEC/Rec2 family competence protein [Helicobacter sp.]